MDKEVREETEDMRTTSGYAIASCVLGVLSLVGILVIFADVSLHFADIVFFGLLASFPLAFIFGVIALVQVGRNHGTIKGIGIALIGTIPGAIATVLIGMVFFLPHHRAPMKTNCLNNLKQIGTAISMYQSDWDDRLPLVSSPGRAFEPVFGVTYNYRTGQARGGERRYFQNLVGPYAKNKRIFMCPTVGEDAMWKNKYGTVTYFWNRHGGFTHELGDEHGSRNPHRKVVVTGPRGSSTIQLPLADDPPTSYWFNVAVVHPTTKVEKIVSGKPEDFCAKTAEAPIVWDTPCGLDSGTGEGNLAHEDVINVCYVDGHAKPWQVPNTTVDEWTKHHFWETHGYEGWFPE